MSKRSIALFLAAGFLACSLGATGARAGTVMVSEDEGTFNFTLTVTTPDVLTITYSAPYEDQRGVDSNRIDRVNIRDQDGHNHLDHNDRGIHELHRGRVPADKSFGTGVGAISRQRSAIRYRPGLRCRAS